MVLQRPVGELHVCGRVRHRDRVPEYIKLRDAKTPTLLATVVSYEAIKNRSGSCVHVVIARIPVLVIFMLDI